MLDLGNFWKSTDCANSLTSDDISQFVRELKAEGVLQPEPMIFVAPKMYNTIRYLVHLSKYPLPSRKLRKCHLRKRAKRLKRDRRRYAE